MIPSFVVVATVRSREKGQRMLESIDEERRKRVSYVVVEDIVEEGAFDEVRKLLGSPSWCNRNLTRTKFSKTGGRSVMLSTRLHLTRCGGMIRSRIASNQPSRPPRVSSLQSVHTRPPSGE